MSDINLNHKVAHNILPIASIAFGYRIKSGLGVNKEIISKYSEYMQDGFRCLPITVFFDGSTHWLVDGLHRIYAMKAIGRTKVLAELLFRSRVDHLPHSTCNITNTRQQANYFDRHRMFEEILYASNRDTSLSQAQIRNRQRSRRCRNH